MPQFARPSTDTTNQSWDEDDATTTAIWDQIDEVSADDADYIRSPLVPAHNIYVTKLTGVTDPLQSGGHTVRFRYGKDASAGAQIDLTIQLRQGYTNEGAQGTLIATIATLTNIGVFPIAGTYTLSGAEADSISDYSNLYLRFDANQV